jgi:pimeloyl-ACP methyl ester carboxylesterase
MGAWCWTDNFLPWFAKQGYDSYAMSLRNHGNSPDKGKLVFRRVKEYVKDLGNTVEKLKGPVHIIGHSMGGFTLQHYLANPSEKLGKAVLLCAAPPHGSWKLVGSLVREHPFLFAKGNLLMSWLPVLGDRANARKIMFSANCPDERLEYAMRHLKDESFMVFLDMILLDLPKPAAAKRKPIIVGAEKDFLVPLKDTLTMAKAYGVEPYIIPDASHNFFLEPGWEKTAEVVLHFLEE